jgi:hypothetical protein
MNSNDTKSMIGDRRAIIIALKKRLRALELSDAKLGAYVPPHVAVEIDDIKQQISAHERDIGESRGFLRKEAKLERAIDAIRERINAGNKTGMGALVKRLGNIEEERYINIKKLISDQDHIHLQTIFVDGVFSPDVEYLNEHLAWLLFPQRSKVLTIESLEYIRTCIKENVDLAIRLDPVITRRIEDEYQLSRRLIPPPYFINLSDDLSKYCDAFEFSRHFHPESKNQIIALFGREKSGKTETLRYFQRASPSTDTFYAFIDAEGIESDISLVLLNIQQAFCENMLHIFIQYPFIWTLLSAENQSLVASVIRQHHSILESETFNHDPINMIKPWLRGSPDRLIADASESLIRMLQDIYRDQHARQGERIFLDELGDIISVLKYTSVCVFIDNLHEKWRSATLLRFLNGHLPQEVLLRISYRRNILADPSFLELKWDSDKLGAVFETMLGRPNKFDAYPEVSKQLIHQMTVPSDFQVWLAVFEEIYPEGGDVTPDAWKRVHSAMHQARNELTPMAADWSEQVSTRAIAILKEEQA